jgi:hypothetical protein
MHRWLLLVKDGPAVEVHCNDDRHIGRYIGSSVTRGPDAISACIPKYSTAPSLGAEVLMLDGMYVCTYIIYMTWYARTCTHPFRPSYHVSLHNTYFNIYMGRFYASATLLSHSGGEYIPTLGTAHCEGDPYIRFTPRQQASSFYIVRTKGREFFPRARETIKILASWI